MPESWVSVVAPLAESLSLSSAAASAAFEVLPVSLASVDSSPRPRPRPRRPRRRRRCPLAPDSPVSLSLDDVSCGPSPVASPSAASLSSPSPTMVMTLIPESGAAVSPGVKNSGEKLGTACGRLRPRPPRPPRPRSSAAPTSPVTMENSGAAVSELPRLPEVSVVSVVSAVSSPLASAAGLSDSMSPAGLRDLSVADCFLVRLRLPLLPVAAELGADAEGASSAEGALRSTEGGVSLPPATSRATCSRVTPLCALLTVIPCSASAAMISLLVIPRALAAACARIRSGSVLISTLAPTTVVVSDTGFSL